MDQGIYQENDEFTVNIALIDRNTPVMGVIFVPVLRQLYFAAREFLGAYRMTLDTQADVNFSGDLHRRLAAEADTPFMPARAKVGLCHHCGQPVPCHSRTYRVRMWKETPGIW
ncbi:MAG: inositol monophosphatase family protein [Desulfobacterales bacterium]